MRNVLNQLKQQQAALITDLFKLAVVFEKTGSSRKRRNARNRSKTVRKNLVLNEQTLNAYA